MMAAFGRDRYREQNVQDATAYLFGERSPSERLDVTLWTHSSATVKKGFKERNAQPILSAKSASLSVMKEGPPERRSSSRCFGL